MQRGELLSETLLTPERPKKEDHPSQHPPPHHLGRRKWREVGQNAAAGGIQPEPEPEPAEMGMGGSGGLKALPGSSRVHSQGSPFVLLACPYVFTRFSKQSTPGATGSEVRTPSTLGPGG